MVGDVGDKEDMTELACNEYWYTLIQQILF